MKNSRRNFLTKGLLAGVGALSIPKLAKAVVQGQTAVNAPKINLKQNAVILLQGDSITDSGRDKASNISNSFPMLGNGYSLFIASQLLSLYASNDLKFFNRGVNSDKVHQMRERWDTDCLAIQPDVLSILIGVNNYKHTLTTGFKGTLEDYENDYRSLLDYTKEKLPNVQLVIGEPFALKGGANIDAQGWDLSKFEPYRKVTKKIADEFKAVFIPYQAGFEAAMKQAPTRYWSYDGVHPDLPGRQLMANLWLEATGLS